MTSSKTLQLLTHSDVNGTNTFLDEVTSQFLTCRLCFQPYRRPPKSLRCLHAFCAPCLERHQDATAPSPGHASSLPRHAAGPPGPVSSSFGHASGSLGLASRPFGIASTSYRRYGQSKRPIHSATIVCPVCSRTTELPPGGVCRLPDNSLLGQLGEVVHRLKETSEVEDTAADGVAAKASSPLCDVCRSVRGKTSSLSRVTQDKEDAEYSKKYGNLRTTSRCEKKSDDETDSESSDESDWRSKLENKTVDECSLSFRNSWTNITTRREPTRKRKRKSQGTFENHRASSTTLDERLDKDSKTAARGAAADDSRCSSSSGVSEISDDVTNSESAVAVAKCIDCNKLLCEDCKRHHRRLSVTSLHSLVDIECSGDVECRRHVGEPLRYYCQPCSACICLLCTLDEHHQHEVTSLQDGMSLHRCFLVQLVDRCRQRRDQLRQHLEDVERAESERRETLAAIHRSANRAVAQIREKEEMMVAEVESEYGEDFDVILDERASILEDLKTLDNICHLAEVILENNSVELLLMKSEMEEKCGKLLEKEIHPLSLSLSDSRPRHLCFTNGTGLVLFGSVSATEMSDASTETELKYSTDVRNDLDLPPGASAGDKSDQVVTGSLQSSNGIKNSQSCRARSRVDGEFDNNNSVALETNLTLESERLSKLDYLNCAIDNVVLTKTYYQRRRNNLTDPRHRFQDSNPNVKILKENQTMDDESEFRSRDVRGIRRKIRSQSENNNLQVSPVCEEDFLSDSSINEADKVNSANDKEAKKNRCAADARFANLSSYPIDIILDTDFVLEIDEIDEELEITESTLPFYPNDHFVVDSSFIPESKSSSLEGNNGGGGLYVIVADVQVDVPLETFYVILDDVRPEGFNCEKVESRRADTSAKDNNFKTKMADIKMAEIKMADGTKSDNNSNKSIQLCHSCLSKIDSTSDKLTNLSNCNIKSDLKDSTLLLEQNEIVDGSKVNNTLEKSDTEVVSNLVTSVILCADDDLKPLQYFDIQSPEVENVILRLSEGKIENTTSSKADMSSQTINQYNGKHESKSTSQPKSDFCGNNLGLSEINRIVNSKEFKRISELLKYNPLQSRHSSSLPGELNIITLLSSSDALINTTFTRLESTLKQCEMAEVSAKVSAIASYSTSEDRSIDESSLKNRASRSSISDEDTMKVNRKTEQILTELCKDSSELSNPDIKPDSMSTHFTGGPKSGNSRGCTADPDCSNNNNTVLRSNTNHASSNKSEMKNKCNNAEAINNDDCSRNVDDNEIRIDKNSVDAGMLTEALESHSVGIGEFNSVTLIDVTTNTEISINDATTSTASILFNDVTTSTDVIALDAVTTSTDVRDCTDVTTSTDETVLNDVTTSTDVIALNDVTTSTDVIVLNDVTTSTDETALNDVTTSTDITCNDATTSTEVTECADNTTSTDVIVTSDVGCGVGIVTCECVGTLTEQSLSQNICSVESKMLLNDNFSTIDGANEQTSALNISSIYSTSLLREDFKTVSNGKHPCLIASDGKDPGLIASDGKDSSRTLANENDFGNNSSGVPPMNGKTSSSEMAHMSDHPRSQTVEHRVRSSANKVEYPMVRFTCESELGSDARVDWEGSDLDEAMIQAIPEVAVVTPEVVFAQPDAVSSKSRDNGIEYDGIRSVVTEKSVDLNHIEMNGSIENIDRFLEVSFEGRQTDNIQEVTKRNEDQETDGIRCEVLAKRLDLRRTVHIFELSEFDEDSETEEEDEGEDKEKEEDEEEDLYSSCLALNDQDLSQAPHAEKSSALSQGSSEDVTSVLTQAFIASPLVPSEASDPPVPPVPSEPSVPSEHSAVTSQRYEECMEENCFEQIEGMIISTEDITRDGTLSPIQEETKEIVSSTDSQAVNHSYSPCMEESTLDFKSAIDDKYPSDSNSVSSCSSSASSSVSHVIEQSDLTLSQLYVSKGLGEQVSTGSRASYDQNTGQTLDSKRFAESQGSYSDLVLLTDLPSFLALADRTFSASTSDIPTNQVASSYHVIRLIKSDESLNKRWRIGRGLSNSESRLQSCGISPRISRERTQRISKEKESIDSEIIKTGNAAERFPNTALTYAGFFSDDSIYEYDAVSGSLRVLEDDENFQSVTSLADNSQSRDKLDQLGLVDVAPSQNSNDDDSTRTENVSSSISRTSVTTEQVLGEIAFPRHPDGSSLRKCLQKPKLFISALFDLLTISPTCELSDQYNGVEMDRRDEAFDSKLPQENCELSSKDSIYSCEDLRLVAENDESIKSCGEIKLGNELLDRYLQISQSLSEKSASNKSETDVDTSLASINQSIKQSGEKIHCLDSTNHATKFSTPKFNVRVHKLNVLKRLDGYEDDCNKD